MTIIVDAIFTITLALLSPTGEQVEHAAVTFGNQKECTAFRADKIEHAKELLAKAEFKGAKFYIGDCVAVPVTEVR